MFTASSGRYFDVAGVLSAIGNSDKSTKWGKFLMRFPCLRLAVIEAESYRKRGYVFEIFPGAAAAAAFKPFTSESTISRE